MIKILWSFHHVTCKGLKKGYFQQILEHHHCGREAVLTNGASARSKGEGSLTTDSTSAAAGFTQHYTAHRCFQGITTGRYICGGMMGSDG